jgi:hypothetical protein
MLQRAFASVLLLLTLGGLSLSPARAAEPEPCASGSYLDDDHDGRPEALRLNCAFATDHDAITIYPRAATLDPTVDWRRNLDMERAIWLFDAGADGRANLIIEFARAGQALVATIYDDQDGDGRVSFELQQGLPAVAERPPRLTGPAWSARVTAPDGWWIRDDQVNFNLTVEVDGPVRATFGPDITYTRMILDGTPDALVSVADSDRNGVPDRDVRRLLMPLPSLDGYYRANIMVNEGNEDLPLQYSILWPYLGSTAAALRGYNPTVVEAFSGRGGRGYGIVRNYHENPAPLQVEWGRSKLQYIGEFVPSRGGEQQWFVYSLAGTAPGRATPTNFESPFAFYDLANDRDGIPELAIRHVYYAPNDPFYVSGTVKHAIRIVRYSWDQDNNQSWDYKLGLISRSSAISDTIALGDVTINALPYRALPAAMIDQPSDAITFVAQETGGRWTSEGIYQWDDAPELSFGYLSGIESRQPNQAFTTIAAGFRGEVSLDLHQPPRLYFSPIDRKLHLHGATRGVLNMGSQGELRTADNDGDGYLDQWTHTQVFTGTETITRSAQLNRSGSHLIYAADNEVLLRQASAPISAWESAPPVDHAGWEQLGQRLDQEQPAPPAADLRRMIEPFGGPELRISGAQLRDYRAHGDLFRFTLELQPGFAVHGADLLDLAGLAPGGYVVTYDGALHVAPLSPPSLSAALTDAPQSELEPGLIGLSIRNDGLQDASNALLELWAQPAGGAATVVVSDTVSVLGQQSLSLRLAWTPPRAGAWTLTPKIRLADQSTVALQPAQVTIRPQTGVSARSVLLASASPRTLPAAALALAAFACTALAIIWRQWNRADETEVACD